MLENLDKLIDYNLKLISSTPDHVCSVFDIKDLDGEDHMQPKRLVLIMQEKGLVTLGTSRVDLTNAGYQIVQSGGWIQFLERKKIIEKVRDEETKRDKEVERKKSTYDLKLKKWQVKTFWPVFVFGLAGFLIGIFNLVYSLSKSKSAEKQEQRIEQMALELEKLQTSISAQKTADSLTTSKDANDNKNNQTPEDK